MTPEAPDGIQKLASYALWARGENWGRDAFLPFLARLFRSGLFLPPLLAYDIRSTAERGERRAGLSAHRPRNLVAWAGFMSWSHAEMSRRVPPAGPNRPAATEEAASRLATIIALNLMARFDFSAFRGPDGFVPQLAIDREIRRLGGVPLLDDPLAPAWAFLDDVATSGRFGELLPLSELLAPGGRPGESVDPFLAKLLERDDRPGADGPSLLGSLPSLDNPRWDLFDMGEIPERDLGPLPSELGRLSPTELLLYRQATHGPRGGKQGTQRVRYRTLFLVRATQSGLLQRFHSDLRSADRKPVVHVQVDLFDNPGDHQLGNVPGCPPVISWHRALAVQVVHQFARVCLLTRWSSSFAFSHVDGLREQRFELECDRLARLAESPVTALECLIAACPHAFTAARSRSRLSRGLAAAIHRNVDFVFRVAIGLDPSFARDPFRPREFEAADVRSTHIGRHPDGFWLDDAADGFDVHSHALADKEGRNEPDLKPAGAASRVLRRLLHLGADETDSAEIGP